MSLMFQLSSGLHCYFYSPNFLYLTRPQIRQKHTTYSSNILTINIVEIFFPIKVLTIEA